MNTMHPLEQFDAGDFMREYLGLPVLEASDQRQWFTNAAGKRCCKRIFFVKLRCSPHPGRLYVICKPGYQDLHVFARSHADADSVLHCLMVVNRLWFRDDEGVLIVWGDRPFTEQTRDDLIAIAKWRLEKKLDEREAERRAARIKEDQDRERRLSEAELRRKCELSQEADRRKEAALLELDQRLARARATLKPPERFAEVTRLLLARARVRDTIFGDDGTPSRELAALVVARAKQVMAGLRAQGLTLDDVSHDKGRRAAP